MRRLLSVFAVAAFALALSACNNCGCNQPNKCNQPNNCNQPNKCNTCNQPNKCNTCAKPACGCAK